MSTSRTREIVGILEPKTALKRAALDYSKVISIN